MDASETGFVAAYHDILLHAGTAFRTILLHLANLPPPSSSSGPSSTSAPLGALIHCTAGKDRTGAFFALLFSYLGVPAPAIATEYNLTELGLSHVRDDVVARLTQAAGFKQFALKHMAAADPSLRITEQDYKNSIVPGAAGPGKVLIGGEEVEVPEGVVEMARQAALRMIGARRESMLGFLELVEREWGSAEGYLRKMCGLDEEDLGKLRRVLVLET
jgi:hypothetical protein